MVHGLAALMLQSCHVLLVQAQSRDGVPHGPVCRAGHPGPCAPGRNHSRTPTSSCADAFSGSDSRCIRTVLCRELPQTPTPCRPIPWLPRPPACMQPPTLVQLCFGPKGLLLQRGQQERGSWLQCCAFSFPLLG